LRRRRECRVRRRFQEDNKFAEDTCQQKDNRSGLNEGSLKTELRTGYFSFSYSALVGQLGKSREFSRLAVASAERAEEKETAAGCEAGAALREALFGNGVEAKCFSRTRQCKAMVTAG
jgi:hypothetical protein